MNTIKAIKPGPKPNKPDGTPDKRRRVTPETKPKHKLFDKTIPKFSIAKINLWFH